MMKIYIHRRPLMKVLDKNGMMHKFSLSQPAHITHSGGAILSILVTACLSVRNSEDHLTFKAI